MWNKEELFMSKFCPKCGTQVQDDANFCMKCGYNFNAQAASAAAATVAAPVQTQPGPSTARPWIQNSGVVNPNPVAGYDQYNPTFHCKCEYCYFEFDYHTYDLGHRAWYPHGFVYCPRCQKPLRHKLEYEVLTNVAPVQPAAPVAPVVPAQQAPASPQS
jgi:uncharacterized Zn finger protein (UPF0148 family)